MGENLLWSNHLGQRRVVVGKWWFKKLVGRGVLWYIIWQAAKFGPVS